MSTKADDLGGRAPAEACESEEPVRARWARPERSATRRCRQTVRDAIEAGRQFGDGLPWHGIDCGDGPTPSLCIHDGGNGSNRLPSQGHRIGAGVGPEASRNGLAGRRHSTKLLAATETPEKENITVPRTGCPKTCAGAKTLKSSISSSCERVFSPCFRRRWCSRTLGLLR